MADETLAAAQRAAGDSYEIVSALGSDAEGHAVFLARQRSSGQMVALRRRQAANGAITMEELPASGGAPPAADDPGRTVAQAGLTGATRIEAAAPTSVAPQVAPSRPSPAAAGLSTPANAPTALQPGPAASPTLAAPAPPLPRPPSSTPASSAATASAGGGDAPRVCPQCGALYGPHDRFCPTDGSTLIAQAPAHGLVGQVLARRYEIRRLLGEGGMGQVYLAEQIKMRRLCALKVMHAEQMHDADAAGRFGREAYNASRIMNAHVAAIYDFGETDDGRLYIAMEYVEGAPLSDLLRREQRLPIARAVDIASQIADALGAAHELSIVHRDLKPDNVMMTTTRSGRDVVKVVDFGIAKAVQTDGQQITRTGFIVGTPAYMSPEQITGDPLDGRSDLYALGCILFKMLTGTEPLSGQGQAMLMRRLSEPPPDPRSLNPEVSPALAAVVLRALARTAAERYATAEAFGQALAAAGTASGSTEAARPGILSDLLGKLSAWSGGRRRAPPAGGLPSPGREGRSITPPSPALAQPRVQWSGSTAAVGARHDTPGGGLAAARSPAAVADAQASSPGAWRVQVEPPGARPAAFTPPGPQGARRLSRPVVVTTAVAASAVAVAAVLFLRRPPPNPASDDGKAKRPPAAVVVPKLPPTSVPTVPDASVKRSSSKSVGDSLAAADAARSAALRRFQQAETSSLRARDLAVGGGATATELASGDSFRERADNAAGAGQYGVATTLITRATEGWRGAQQAAEARVKLAQSSPTPTKPQPPVVKVDSAPPPTQPAGGSSLPAGGTPAGGAAGTDVRSVLTAYVAAVNARQMAEMRRVWPTMPDDAAHNWQALFNAATDLNVTLVSADPPTINGSHAQTVFAYSMTGFVPSQGAIPPATLRFKVKLDRDAFGWRIVSMDRQK